MLNGYMKNAAKAFMSQFQRVSPTLATKILFRRYIGKKLDLKNPRTLNEKMQWLKLNRYSNDPLVTRCVDK